MMFGGVSESPIADTFNGLVEMGFVDYRGFSTFLNIQGAFPHFSDIMFTGAKMTEEQTAGTVRWKVIAIWLSAVGGPEISAMSKYSRLIGNSPRFLQIS